MSSPRLRLTMLEEKLKIDAWAGHSVVTMPRTGVRDDTGCPRHGKRLEIRSRRWRLAFFAKLQRSNARALG